MSKDYPNYDLVEKDHTGFVLLDKWAYFIYKGYEANWTTDSAHNGCGWNTGLNSAIRDKADYIKKQLNYYEGNEQACRVLMAELLGAE